jgi:hypothetical protein
LIRAVFLNALVILAVSGQPKGYPALQAPPDNHATRLSGTVAGRPMPSRPGAHPVYPLPVYVNPGVWYPPQPVQPVIFVNQQNVAPAPAPILIVNPDYKPDVVKPVMREYFAESKPYENFTPAEPKIYLIALKDGSLRQSVAFWRENEKLLFVQPDHKQESIALTSLDREATVRFNKERGIEIRLPE